MRPEHMSAWPDPSNWGRDLTKLVVWIPGHSYHLGIRKQPRMQENDLRTAVFGVSGTPSCISVQPLHRHKLDPAKRTFVGLASWHPPLYLLQAAVQDFHWPLGKSLWDLTVERVKAGYHLPIDEITAQIPWQPYAEVSRTVDVTKHRRPNWSLRCATGWREETISQYHSVGAARDERVEADPNSDRCSRRTPWLMI